MSVRIPKYRLHRGSGRALVEIDGCRSYLGKFGHGRPVDLLDGARVVEIIVIIVQ